MSKNKKRELVTSPVGEAVWPNLNVPDTRFKAEGEYGTKLRLDPSKAEVQGFVAAIEERVEAAFQKAKDENPKFAKVMKSVSPVKAELDDNGDETGMIVLNFKKAAQVTSKKDGKTYKFRVALYDANLAPLPSGVKVGGGSKIRVSFEPFPYFNAKDKEAGISLRLEAAQIIELKEWQGKSGKSFGFGKEEGGFDSTQLPAGDSQDEFANAESEGEDAAPAKKSNGDF